MPSAEHDLGYLEASVDLLEKYLLSKDIYWKMTASPPPGEPSYPSLTLGGVLLARERTGGRQLSPQQSQKNIQLEAEIDRIHSKWRTAWENKSREEFRARLNLWRDFLEEFRQDPEDNLDRFAYEVSRRVMLQLLEKDARLIPVVETQMLEGLDAVLSGLFIAGDFVWDKELQSSFSKDEYPYLYGRLRGKN